MYGLLGKTLKSSFSKEIHVMFGVKDYDYYEITPENLESFIKSGEFSGLNVTMPYKIDVMKYLDYISDEAREVGSVNTIVRDRNGRLTGYNTDVYGFEAMLDKAGFEVTGKKVLVLGSGGASRAVCYVLNKREASDIIVISRSGENNYENISKHYDADYIINATPIGMSPNVDERILDLSHFNNLKGVGDLIYNPLRTELMLQAEDLGIPTIGGLYMLVAQAKRADELYLKKKITNSRLDNVYRKIYKEKRNIVLIGMPGSGKTTIGKWFAKILEIKFYDTDKMIRASENRSSQQIIEADGEEAFRIIESRIIKEVSLKNNSVIVAGGGAVTIPYNRNALRHNSLVVYVKRPLENLATKGRPLSQKMSVDKLYAQRKDMYEKYSDVAIDNDKEPKDALKKLKELL